MLACRSLFRVDRVLTLRNAYVKSKQLNYCQVYCSSHGLGCRLTMDGAKDKLGSMHMNKKKKSVNPVWRPVCTQASPLEECIVKDVTLESESGSQMQEVHSSIATDVSDAQHSLKISSTVDEVMIDMAVSSSAQKDDIEDRVLDGETECLAEKYSRPLEVGASVFRFIRGKEGSTQKKIEEEMGVTITFPSSKKEDSIVIEGSSVDSVIKASEKIQIIIDEAVKTPSLDYSHFVSLPLAIHPELVDKLVNFQNTILANSSGCLDDDNKESVQDGDTSENVAEEPQLDKAHNVTVRLKVADDNESVKVGVTSIPLVSYAAKTSKPRNLVGLGIEKSIFIKPKTFHLTVLMLKLWNKERVNAASDILKSISSKVMDALDNRPVFVRLKGLDCMRGSLAKASVVYAPVEEIGSENRLLRACQVIIDAFVEAGLVMEKDAKQRLKLHATVMNARHRKRKTNRRKPDFVDARDIFKQFGSHEWGEYHIREAHLSQRFVFDENGYYHCCASIPFPQDVQVD